MPLWMRQALAQRQFMEAAANPDDPGGGGGGDKSGDKSGEKGAKPTDKEAELLKEVMAKKDTIKDLEARLKAFDGIDPAKIREMLDQQAAADAKRIEAEQKALEKAGEFDKVKKQIIEAHETEKKTLTTQIEELNKQLSGLGSTIDELTIGSEFKSSEFLKKTFLTKSTARLKYGAHFSRDEQGRVVGYDKPAGVSGRAMFVDGKGDPLPFDAVLEKLVEADPEKEEILRADVRPGAGSDTTATRKNANNGESKVTGRDRIAAALAANKLTAGKQLKFT